MNNKEKKKRIIAISVICLVALAAIITSLVLVFRKPASKQGSVSEKGDWITRLSDADKKKAEVTTAQQLQSSQKKAVKEKTKSETDLKGKSTVSKSSKSVSKGKKEAKARAEEDNNPTTRVEQPTREAATEGTRQETTTESTTQAETTTEKATEGTRQETTTERSTECQHDWVEQTKTEKVLVEEGWDEDVYETRMKCAYCGKDVTGDDGVHVRDCGEVVWDEDMGDYFPVGSAAVSYQKYVKTIHHPDVYEEKTTVIGYKCSKCGATK